MAQTITHNPGVPMAQAINVTPGAPHAAPMAIANPAAHPAAAMFDLPPERADEQARRSGYQRNQHTLHIAIVTVSLLAVLGLGAYGLVALTNWHRTGPGSLEGYRFDSDLFNCTYILPPEPWDHDHNAKRDMLANILAQSRSEPNVWMALAAHDYKTRNPRDAEVVDEAVAKLRNYFGDTLEYDPPMPEKLADKPCQRLVFQGRDLNSVPMMGECFILTYGGIAYWFFTWAPAANLDEARDEFASLRERFYLGRDREGWTETRPTPVPFQGESTNYVITDTEALWTRQIPATDYDSAADLALTARDRTKPLDVSMEAQLLVVMLKPDGASRPEIQARKHYEAEEKKTYDQTTIEVLDEKEEKVGELPGHIARLLVRNTSARHRFAILAVAQQGDTIYAIRGECDWHRRSLWEIDFNRMIASFRMRR
jgi:hypothetical protein